MAPVVAARPALRVLSWVVLAAALLGVVPLVNGFPLIFPDSGTYIRQAMKLEGALDRPPFYSLFLLSLHLGRTLWPIPFVQDLITCAIIFRMLWLALPRLTAPRLALVVVLSGLLTSLPWFSNEIMPDIFTPLILLLVFGLIMCWERLTRAERVILPLALSVMLAFHTASPAFTLAVGAGALLLAALRGITQHAALRSMLLVGGPVLLAVIGQSLYGYAVIKRVTPSPAGPFFALARLLDDGPAKEYLAKACPGAGYILCARQGEITGDNNTFLWSPASPLQAMIRTKGEAGALQEATAIVAGTLRTYPLDVLHHVLLNASRQFVTASTTDVDCPCLDDKIDHVAAELFPGEYAAYAEALQNTGRLPWKLLRRLDGVMVLASAALLIGIVLLRRRALAGRAGQLLALIVWGLLVNAAEMGALSGVADRYQARLIWLVPLFAIALIVSGWRSTVRKASILPD